MNFFEAQRSAKQRTGLLVLLFVAAVAAIVVANYLAFHATMLVSGDGVAGEPLPEFPSLGTFLFVAVATLLVILGGTGYRTAKLRRGGPDVAELAGGRAVEPGAADEAERRLLNVVEEMAIASGVPVPAVYVLDEDGINAFAAGLTIHDAAVAVTRGALERLDRDELQGVVAHEFSHILNGDMRMNVRLIGLLFGILLIAVIGRTLLRGRRVRSSGKRSGNGVALLALMLIIVGYIGVLFGRLIKASISRQREFLADASAVQFTRHPEGIADALKKIGGHATGSRIEDAEAEELSHLFFADALGANLFASHPPLAERIRRIEPGFDGEFVEAVDGMATADRAASAAFAGGEGDPSDAAVAGFAGGAGHPAAATAGGGDAGGDVDAAIGSAAAEAGRGAEAPGRAAGETPVSVQADELMASIGAPTAAHVTRATHLLASIPQELKAAAHTPGGAQALVAALVLDEDGDVAGGQREAIREHGGDGLLEWVDELRPHVRTQPREARLALLDLALPALKRLPPATADDFRDVVDALVRADGRVHLFEYALVNVLNRHLPARTDHGPAHRRPTHRSLAPLRDEVEIVLSAIARSGSTDEAEARAAFAAAVRSLPDGVGEMRLRDTHDAGLAHVDRALDGLARASLDARGGFLRACAGCVAFDDEVRPSEVEILRAIAAGLDCPMPLLVVGGKESH